MKHQESPHSEAALEEPSADHPFAEKGEEYKANLKKQREKIRKDDEEAGKIIKHDGKRKPHDLNKPPEGKMF